MTRHLVVLTFFFFFFAVRYVSGEERLASSTCQYLKECWKYIEFFFFKWVYITAWKRKKLLSRKIRYPATLKKVQVDLNVFS